MIYANQVELLPTNQTSVFNVRLNLPYQAKYIGKIDFTGDGTFITKRKPEHLFKKTNSLGINHSLLTSESIPFKWIVINYAGRELITSRLYFLKYGECYKFGNQGFELQCFLPVDMFGRIRAEQFENSLSTQLNMFDNPVIRAANGNRAN